MVSLKPVPRNLSPRLEGEVESAGSDHCWILPLTHNYSFRCWLRKGKEEKHKKMLLVQQVISHCQSLLRIPVLCEVVKEEVIVLLSSDAEALPAGGPGSFKLVLNECYRFIS